MNLPRMTPPRFDRDAVLDSLHGRYREFYETYTPLKPVAGELRGPCPVHGGDGPNFAVDPDKGHWYCHSGCQAGGDVFDLVERLDSVDFPQALERVAAWAGLTPATQVIRSPRPALVAPPSAPIEYLDPSLAEAAHVRLMEKDGVRTWLAEHRGLTTETLGRFRVGLEPPEVKGGEWRVTFPVFDAEGRLTNIRRHLFAYKAELTDERRRELGKTKPWRKGLRADLFPLAAIEGAADVLLVEGEADALLACQMGFAAVSGTLGAGNWKEHWTEALRGRRRVTILYDADGPGQEGARKAALALSGAVGEVAIGSYPEGVKDLTEWVIGHWATAEDVRKAIDTARPSRPEIVPAPQPSSTPARRKTIAERVISARDVGPPPSELPYQWGPYLNVGASHWLTGATGIGKSTLVYNLVGALTEGATLWDIPCSPIRVLYMDMESGDLGRSLKMSRLYRDGLPPENWLFLREPVRLPEELPDFLAYVQAQAVNLVIFDTARRCFTVRDENDNAEVYNRVVPTLDALKQIGVATLTLGHPPKNGGTGARGAGAQEDAGDVNLSLTMHRGDVSDADGVIALRITKNRLLGLGHPPLFLKRVGEDRFERAGTDEVGGDAGEPVTKRLQCRQAVIDFISENGPASHGQMLAVAKEAGFSKATFDRVLKDLKADKDVVPQADGLYGLDDPFAED